MSHMNWPSVRRNDTHCVNGHEWTEENTAMSRGQRVCRVCNREKAKRYARKHPDKVRQRARAWHERNQERVIEYRRQHYERNAEALRAKARENQRKKRARQLREGR